MQIFCEATDHLPCACDGCKMGLGPKCDVIWQLQAAGQCPAEHWVPKAGQRSHKSVCTCSGSPFALFLPRHLSPLPRSSIVPSDFVFYLQILAFPTGYFMRNTSPGLYKPDFKHFTKVCFPFSEIKPRLSDSEVTKVCFTPCLWIWVESQPGEQTNRSLWLS